MKRQHDRDKSGTIILIYLILTFVVGVVSGLLIPTDLTDPNAALEYINSPVFWVFQAMNLILSGLAIYLLVVCGFFKGTDGPNQYGPDPLA